MDRRGFMQSILAIGCAPAIVRAESLMRIIVPQSIVVPESLVLRPRDTIITVSMITREALELLEKNLIFTSAARHEYLKKAGRGYIFASGSLKEMDALERRYRG